MVEGEDYADRLTADRVRRVIRGYLFSGTQKEELLRETLTWSKFNNNHRILEKISSLENLEGHRFDRIKKELKDGELTIVGEKMVEEHTEGLGGEFTFYVLV